MFESDRRRALYSSVHIQSSQRQSYVLILSSLQAKCRCFGCRKLVISNGTSEFTPCLKKTVPTYRLLFVCQSVKYKPISIKIAKVVLE